MVKIGLSIKLEADQIAKLKEDAKQAETTVSAIVENGIFKAEETQRLKTQVNKHEATIKELQRKYEAATGRKPATTKRITIPVTDAEHKAIKDAAHHANMPMTQVMRRIITGRITKQGALPLTKREDQSD